MESFDALIARTDQRLRPVRAMLDSLGADALAELEQAMRLTLRPAPTPAERRWEELGFLAELLLDRHPNLAGFATIEKVEYDTLAELHARTPLRTLNTSWLPAEPPAASVLVRRYGSWPRACYAAYRLEPDGSTTGDGRPWPAGFRGRGTRPTAYTIPEVLAALRECAFSLGRIPSSADYHRWALHQRAVARAAGLPSRVPCSRTVYRQFPSSSRRRDRWTTIINVAGITLDDLTRARAQWNPSADADEARVGRAVRDALRDIRRPSSSVEGFNDDEIETLITDADAIQRLPLTKATTLARALDGSLDWLLGRTNSREPAARVDCRFDEAAMRSARKARGMTEKELRRQITVTPSAFRSLVNGKREPKLSELDRIASVLGCNVGDLLR